MDVGGKRGRVLTVDYFCGSGVSYRTRATHDEDSALVDIGSLNSRVVVLWSVENRDLRFENHGAVGIFQECFAELIRDDRCLHDGGVEEVSRKMQKSSVGFHRLIVGFDRFAIPAVLVFDIVLNRLAVASQSISMQLALVEKLSHDGRETAGPVVLFAQHTARRLDIHQQRDVEADFLPIVQIKWDTDVLGNSVEVNGCVSRATDGGIGDKGVLEGFACHDVRRLAVRVDHFDDLHAGLVCHLGSFSIGSWDGGTPW